MYKTRILFSKDSPASFISHLDLMRTFQRAVIRAGLNVRHTEGFNPHACIYIAQPLSLGYKSECEMLDVILLDMPDYYDIVTCLNSALPEGLKALSAYQSARPFKEIAFADYEIKLIYDGAFDKDEAEIIKLFSTPPVVISKKSKRSEAETDITRFINEIHIAGKKAGADESVISLIARLSAGEGSLNPKYIIYAIEKYLPGYKPDFFEIRRLSVLDKDLKEFR